MSEQPARPGDQKETAAVTDKAEELLGYHPTTPFTTGIRSEIEWFQALPDDLRPEFEAEFRRRLGTAYPARDGRVLLPFRRIFVVAQVR